MQEFWSTRFENLQGKGVPRNLMHALWSGYHTAREEDSKTEKLMGDWAPEPWQFLSSTAEHEVMSAPHTMYGSLPTY